jgi:hypothetical protein
MEIIIALIAVVVVGAIIYTNREARSLDINKDGKVDLDDAKSAVINTVSAVSKPLDADNDGKIDAKDAKAVASKAKAVVKKTASKAKETVKKTGGRGRTPRSKA